MFHLPRLYSDPCNRFFFIQVGPDDRTECIPLTKGAEISLTSHGAGAGWWKGNCAGRYGAFPETYVEIANGVPAEGSAPPPRPMVSAVASPVSRGATDVGSPVTHDSHGTGGFTVMSSRSQETSTTDFIEFENDDDDLNFWDKNGYQKVLKRIDYGAKACDTLAKMLLERADLEQKRAKDLTQWAERWEQKIEAMPGDSSTSLMRAWTESIKATHHLADSHAAIKKQVVGDGAKGTTGLKGDVEAHRKEHYTTNMLGKFKPKVAAEKALKAAQAPFNEKRAKVEKRTHQLEARKQAVSDALHLSKGVSKAEKEQAKTEGKLAEDIDAMYDTIRTFFFFF